MQLKSVFPVLVLVALSIYSTGARCVAAAAAVGDGINCIGSDRFSPMLLPGQAICTGSGRYAAAYQGTDGNFVVYDRQAAGGPAAIWSLTGNAGIAAANLDPQGRLVILANCNLVYYNSANQVVWQTNTVNQGNNCFAAIQEDANFVLYANYYPDAQPLWSIQTGNIARDTITVAPQDDVFGWTGLSCAGNDTDGYKVYVGGYWGCLQANDMELLVFLNGNQNRATIPARAGAPANTYSGAFDGKAGVNDVQVRLECNPAARIIWTPNYEFQCPTPIAAVEQKKAARLAWNESLFFRLLPKSLRLLF